MRQRLGVASALLWRPVLLLLDEPASAIDPAGAREVRAIVRELAGEGAAVLFSSHDLDDVEQVCDAISVIDRGHVLFAGGISGLRAAAADDPHTLRTADNARALEIAASIAGVRVARGDDDALLVSAAADALDAYMIALGRGGVAVRHLERRPRSLESLFLELTGGPAPEHRRERDLSMVGS
jgi:ABC-2 type transport system ATP-binding protein